MLSKIFDLLHLKDCPLYPLNLIWKDSGISFNFNPILYKLGNKYFKLNKTCSIKINKFCYVENELLFSDEITNNEFQLSNLPKVRNLAFIWNKSILKYYSNMTANQFRRYEQSYIVWFEDEHGISINSKIYNKIPLLYNDNFVTSKPQISYYENGKPIFTPDETKNEPKKIDDLKLSIWGKKLIEILLSEKHKIKHDDLRRKLDEFSEEKLPNSYFQNLTHIFKSKHHLLFLNSEINHKGGYWELKKPNNFKV